MDGSVTVHVLDQATGERLTPSDVMLYRVGVPGENRAEFKHDGSFSFAELSEGEYSLAIYDPRFAPRYERFALQPRDSKILEVHLTRGAFLSGRVLDEQGQSPERGWFTLLRAGERRGRAGYIDDSGDHEVSDEGNFCTPPLHPGKYFLRMAGLLRKSAVAVPSRAQSVLERYFDFCIPTLAI